MSKRNWSIRFAAVVAIGGFAVVSLGTGAFIGASNAPNYGYETAESTDNRAYDKQQPPTQIDRDRAGLPKLAERIASGPDPEDGSEREKRDLAAQESMSVWAFWMLVVSAIGAVVTMIGTVFLAWQIALTREAVKDTGNATKAMVRQNELTEAAQRPWIQVTAEIKDALVAKSGLRFRYSVTLTNIGKSVAHEVRAHIRARNFNWDVYDMAFETFDELGRKNFSDTKVRDLMPGESLSETGMFNLPDGDLVWNEYGECFILIAAVARYGPAPRSQKYFTERAFHVVPGDHVGTNPVIGRVATNAMGPINLSPINSPYVRTR